jgi:hypothetical protein
VEDNKSAIEKYAAEIIHVEETQKDELHVVTGRIVYSMMELAGHEARRPKGEFCAAEQLWRDKIQNMKIIWRKRKK